VLSLERVGHTSVRGHNWLNNDIFTPVHPPIFPYATGIPWNDLLNLQGRQERVYVIVIAIAIAIALAIAFVINSEVNNITSNTGYLARPRVSDRLLYRLQAKSLSTRTTTAANTDNLSTGAIITMATTTIISIVVVVIIMLHLTLLYYLIAIIAPDFVSPSFILDNVIAAAATPTATAAMSATAAAAAAAAADALLLPPTPTTRTTSITTRTIIREALGGKPRYKRGVGLSHFCQGFPSLGQCCINEGLLGCI
jgi:hypothetical protein